jgi:hypothetical protein
LPSPAAEVSGEVPEEPVLSKKSGLLFERRLIERYIEVLLRFPALDSSQVSVCLGFSADFV